MKEIRVFLLLLLNCFAAFSVQGHPTANQLDENELRKCQVACKMCEGTTGRASATDIQLWKSFNPSSFGEKETARSPKHLGVPLLSKVQSGTFIADGTQITIAFPSLAYPPDGVHIAVSRRGFKGKCDQWVLEQAIAMAKEILPSIRAHCRTENCKPRDLQLLLTGVNWGGSLALVAGLYITRELYGPSYNRSSTNNSVVVTFGSPPVFDKIGQEFCNQFLGKSNHLRIEPQAPSAASSTELIEKKIQRAFVCGWPFFQGTEIEISHLTYPTGMLRHSHHLTSLQASSQLQWRSLDM